MTSVKNLFKPGNLISAPGIFDGISARMADQFEFDLLYMTGYGTVASHLGVPDAGIASYADMVGRVQMIASVVKTPFIADGDTGYGGLLNMHHTVKGYEAAGAAGIQIEDQEFPKKCALTEKVKILNFQESCERIKAAVKAAKENKKQDIGIVARTDAYPVLGIKETVKRIKAFKSLGADVIFATGIDTKKDLEAISKYKNLNLMLNITQNVEFSIKDLKKCGIRFAIYSQSILNGYVDTTKTILKTIKQELIPRSKNLSNDTLNILDFQKVLKIEKN